MKKYNALLLGVMLIFILSSCGSPADGTPPAANTPIPSNTFPPTYTPTYTPTASATILPTFTPTLTATPPPLPLITSTPALSPTPTPPTYVRENTPIPVPDEPITAENASQLVELARLGKGTIQDVRLSPNRIYLLVQTTMGVYSYLADRQEEVWQFEDPAGIALMAVPKLERWIAVATNDGRIALLVYQRGSMFTQWATGYGEIRGLAFSYDGAMLAAVGDRGVTIWQVGQTEPLYEYPELVGEMVRFTPDGKSFTLQKGDRLSYMSLITGELERIVDTGIENPVYSVDGQCFADLHVVRDANTGEELVELEPNEVSISTGVLAFSQNGSYLAMAVYPWEEDLGVAIWQAESGRFLFLLLSPLGYGYQPENTAKLAAPFVRSGPQPNYSELAFSPDGRLLAAAHPAGFVDVWDLETNTFIERYSGLGGQVIFRKASRLTIWDELEIRDIEPRSGILINSARDFVAGRRLNFSPDGRWLFADWVVWDMDDLERAFRFGDEIVAAISPDGQYLYSYDWYEHIIYQRRMDGFGVVEQVDLAWDFEDDLNPIVWGPQSSGFSISSTGSYFSTWLYAYGNQTWNIPSNQIEPELNTNFLQTYHYYSPYGKYLAISAEEDVSIFQLKPEIKRVQGIEGNTCGFSPNGEHLLVKRQGLHYLYTLQDDGQFVKGSAFVINTDEWPFPCKVAFSGDSLLAAIDWSTLILVDLTNGQTVFEIPAHLDQITSIAFSHDGLYLATSSYDGTVKLWGVMPED